MRFPVKLPKLRTRRDRLVFERARQLAVPVAVTLAGGYARHVADTVHIHANTVRMAREFAPKDLSQTH